MGTRADFYVGRGPDAEWIGSIAYDGYPDGIPDMLKRSSHEKRFREQVEKFYVDRDDVTLPEDGWPWPWVTSATTDYAYAFDAGKVWGSGFGRPWWEAASDEPKAYDEDGEEIVLEGDPPVFPDMTDKQNVTLGPRSGVMFLDLR